MTNSIDHVIITFSSPSSEQTKQLAIYVDDNEKTVTKYIEKCYREYLAFLQKEYKD